MPQTLRMRDCFCQTDDIVPLGRLGVQNRKGIGLPVVTKASC